MRKSQIVWGTVLFIAVFVCGICLGYLLNENGKTQIQQSSEFQIRVTASSSSAIPSSAISSSEVTTASESETETLSVQEDIWPDTGYNYLAIGNSITKHNITSYWWNEIGMAASDADRDYFHIVLKNLEEKHDNVKGLAFNLYGWEGQSHDRDGALYLLDDYLSPNLNLVTVQLGENVDDLATFQSDFLSLLLYIKRKAPNARIIVVGDFWNKDNRNEMKENAAKEANAEFVSLEGIASNQAYYRGLGSWVYDAEGNPHLVEHEGVAIHPGDAGMKAIADRIIAVLN